jgi:hypothetical protein
MQFIIAIFEIISVPISSTPRYRGWKINLDIVQEHSCKSKRARTPITGLSTRFNSSYSGLRKIGSPPGLDRLRLVLLLLLKPVVVPDLNRLVRSLWRVTWCAAGAFASGWLEAEGAA